MNEERIQKVIEAISQYGDVQALMAMTPEEATKALNANGCDVTVEEVDALGAAFATVGKAELSDSDLENVAGGYSGAWWALTAAQSACTAGGIICAYAALCCW